MAYLQKQRNLAALNYNLSLIKKGEHWNEDLKPAVKEKMLFKNPDPEEKDVESSKSALLSASNLTYSTRRDLALDYANPREELTKFDKYVEQIPPFDKGPLGMLHRSYDDQGRQQVNQVIRGRESFILEEGKYDVTMENTKEKMKQQRDKQLSGPSKAPSVTGPTPSMAAELRRQSLMESTQSL